MHKSPASVRSGLRLSEWALIGFFFYICLLTPFFRDRPRLGLQPFCVLGCALALLLTLSKLEHAKWPSAISMIRDWLPLAFTLAAFREMELFVPVKYNARYEHAWVRWDGILLNQAGLKRAVESLGFLIPTYLELCYLLVYGVGAFCVIVLWLKTNRREVDRFYLVLLTGTLLAYGMFPFFPSRPPRIAFPDVAPPLEANVFRTANLFLLRKATIHSGVFPSAHVSSAFAAAWAMFLVLPGNKRIAWGLLFYAASVAVATVYGRYHYAADALAGFAVSLVAAGVCLMMRSRQNLRALRRTSERW